MGHFHCLDAATGKVLWSKLPGRDHQIKVPIWGVAAAPLVEQDLLILQIGETDGGCVMAFDTRTGGLRWKALDDPASYSAPICIDQAGRRVAVCWTGTHIVGLAPESGQVLWRHHYGFTRWVIAIATPVVHRDRMLLSASDNGAMMLRLATDRPGVEQLWWRKGTRENTSDGLHALMCTPWLTDGHAYGVNVNGVMRCLDTADGDRVWEDTTVTSQTRWGNAHLVRHGERTWIFNDRGELIIARLSPAGYEEISRAKLIDTTTGQLRRRDGVTWTHPAFAHRHVFIRNDKELVCASLMRDGSPNVLPPSSPR